MIKNIFDQSVTSEVIERINTLTPETKQNWGKMNISQMLAHCSVTYEMIYDESVPAKPKGFKGWMLRKFVKPIVCNDVPYKHNGRTAPQFLKTEQYEFEQEKTKLVNYINKTTELGEAHFDGKESHSFGKLTKAEWNNMFYKHLDHHLQQFGA